jgi:hypothetical protein
MHTELGSCHGNQLLCAWWLRLATQHVSELSTPVHWGKNRSTRAKVPAVLSHLAAFVQTSVTGLIEGYKRVSF